MAEARDPKGLYAKARRGELADFTGVSPSAPYEEPEEPEIVIRSAEVGVEEAVDRIVAVLEERGLLENEEEKRREESGGGEGKRLGRVRDRLMASR